MVDRTFVGQVYQELDDPRLGFKAGQTMSPTKRWRSSSAQPPDTTGFQSKRLRPGVSLRYKGLPHGADLLLADQPGRVVGDLAYDVVCSEGDNPQGPVIDPKNVRCHYCGGDNLALPTSVEPA